MSTLSHEDIQEIIETALGGIYADLQHPPRWSDWIIGRLSRLFR